MLKKNHFIIKSALFSLFLLTLGASSAHAISAEDGSLALSDEEVIALAGVQEGDEAGTSVSTAGDVNGDGYGDILIGAPEAAGDDTNAGAVYLVYGQSAKLTSRSLSTVVKFSGEETYAETGSSVSTAGDVNGDGYDDILIGAGDADSDESFSGAVYLIYGQSAKLTSRSLSTVVKFSGEDGFDKAGTSVSTAGDVNGDGYDDFLIGAPGAVGDDTNTGAVYLVYGQSAKLTSRSLSTAVKFSGKEMHDEAGTSVSTAGDVNRDGYDDILIGANYEDGDVADCGAAYLIYGQSAKLTSRSLSTAIQLGTDNQPGIGHMSVSTAGDVNGDGYDDFLVGDAEGDGIVYLVYGQSAKLTSRSLSTTVEFSESNSTGNIGNSVSSAGDVNGDGYDDFLIGDDDASSGSGSIDTGAAHLVYGQATKLTSRSVSSSVKIYGISFYDQAGSSVSTAGDINGDGVSDFLIGAPGVEDLAGAAYIVYSDYIPPVEEEPEISSDDNSPSIISGDSKGYYIIKTEDGDTIRVHGFSSYTGSKKTKVTYYSKRDVYVIYHPLFKSIIAVDGSTGEEIDRMKLFSKPSTKGTVGKMVTVGKKKMLMISAGKKKTSRFGVIRLGKSGAEDVFVKKDVVTLKGTKLKYGATPTVKKESKKVYRITLKDSDGNPIQIQLKKPLGKLRISML